MSVTGQGHLVTATIVNTAQSQPTLRCSQGEMTVQLLNALWSPSGSLSHSASQTVSHVGQVFLSRILLMAREVPVKQVGKCSPSRHPLDINFVGVRKIWLYH